MGKPYPIATTDVEPDSFYYYLTPDGYRLCAEVVDVPYLDALDRFGAGLDGEGRVTAPVKGLKPGDAYGLPRPEWSRAMHGDELPDPHGAVVPDRVHVRPQRARADVLLRRPGSGPRARWSSASSTATATPGRGR